MKVEVHRVGVRGPFRASRLGRDELGVQRACQALDDFVLHVEEIGERLIEPLGPEMIARFSVDELDVDAHSASAALDARRIHSVSGINSAGAGPRCRLSNALTCSLQ